MRLKTNQEGFSLLELIIVVTVLGIIAMLTGVIPGGFLTSSDIDSSANIMISDIKTMRSKSVAGVDGNGDDVADRWGVCFKSSDSSYNLVYLPSPSDTDPCDPSPEATVFLQGGVTFSDPTTGNNEAVYFEKISGESSSDSDITVTVTKGGVSRTVTITPSGTVY